MKELDELRKSVDREFIEEIKQYVLNELDLDNETYLEFVRNTVDIIFKDPVEREIDNHLMEVGKLFLESQNKLLEIRKIFEKEIKSSLVDGNELNKITDRLMRKLFRY